MRKRQEAKNIDEGLRLAIEAVGTRYALARALGLTPTSVLRWDKIPMDRLLDVERATGIPRAKLRPEFYT